MIGVIYTRNVIVMEKPELLEQLSKCVPFHYPRLEDLFDTIRNLGKNTLFECVNRHFPSFLR
ncbi:hypothetical protein D3C75_1019110 [compost metagenome]